METSGYILQTKDCIISNQVLHQDILPRSELANRALNPGRTHFILMPPIDNR